MQMGNHISGLTVNNNNYYYYFCIYFTAVRRLMRQAIELREPSPLYHAQPMEVSISTFNVEWSLL